MGGGWARGEGEGKGSYWNDSIKRNSGCNNNGTVEHLKESFILPQHPPSPPPTHLKWKLINSNRSDYSVRNSGADIERNPIRVDSRQLDSTRLSFFVVVVVVAVVVAAVGREIFQTK